MAVRSGQASEPSQRLGSVRPDAHAEAQASAWALVDYSFAAYLNDRLSRTRKPVTAPFSMVTS
jgi:hypothetical protein